MDSPALKAVIALVERSVAVHEQITCRQLLTVLYALEADGMLQKELAAKLGVTESTVSRNYKVLGPKGTGCIRKEGDLVIPSECVIDCLEELFGEK